MIPSQTGHRLRDNQPPARPSTYYAITNSKPSLTSHESRLNATSNFFLFTAQSGCQRRQNLSQSSECCLAHRQSETNWNGHFMADCPGSSVSICAVTAP